MLEVYGKKYYIDVERVMDLCHIETENDKKEIELDVDSYRFNCYKTMIDRIILEYTGDEDGDTVAFTSKTTDPGFGISFNTLLKTKILKTIKT